MSTIEQRIKDHLAKGGKAVDPMMMKNPVIGPQIGPDDVGVVIQSQILLSLRKVFSEMPTERLHRVKTILEETLAERPDARR